MNAVPSAVNWTDLPLGSLPGFPAAVGGDLTAATVLNAFQQGFFPLPSFESEIIDINEILYSDHVEAGRITMLPTAGNLSPYMVTWWHPAQRSVIPVGQVKLPSYLRQQLRNKYAWTTTANDSFERVVDECGRDRRRWLIEPLVESFLELHRQGWAHSIEVWDGSHLIGGLFGIGVGTVFSMSSTFHTTPGAGKVAFADLDRRLAGTEIALLDTQTPSPHMEALGARCIDRADFTGELLRESGQLAMPTAVMPGIWPALKPQSRRETS